MTSHLTRPRAAVAAGLGIALAASLLGGAAAQASPHDDPIVLDTGHVDLMWATKNQSGEAQLAVNSDDHGTKASEEVVFHLKPSVAQRTANADAIAALGIENTDSFYLAPERYAPGQLFIGFGFDTTSYAVDSIDIERTISNFEGPGDFALWYSTEGSAPLLSTATGATSFVSYGYHEHANWGFSAEGTYSFDISAKITDRATGNVVTTPAQRYTFAVGETVEHNDPAPGAVTLSVTGLAHHYHTGDVAKLTAVQSPAPVSDHFHWFTRESEQAGWTAVEGAYGDSYGFIVTHEHEVKAVLYNHAHEAIAETEPLQIEIDDHGNTPGIGPEVSVTHPVSQGALTVSVAPGHWDAELSDLTLNAEADRLVATGEVAGITVTDTRTENLGWNANGRLRAFVTVDGDDLDGKYLGWAPKVISTSDHQVVNAGSAVAPGFDAGTGIKGWSGLGTAAAGSSLGTAVLGADLTLEAPTNTPVGEYRGVLLLTVI